MRHSIYKVYDKSQLSNNKLKIIKQLENFKTK